MGKSSQGLPNVGNTCFLNSILQGLFSVQKFRQQILKQEQSQQKMSGHMRKIFLAIKEQIDEESKTKILKSFQQFLTKFVEDYIGYTQQDAVFFLLQILNKLNQQNQKYLKYFQFDTIQKCQNNCQQSNYILQNQILFSSQQIQCSCTKCADSKILKYLNRIPEAIFITEINDKKQEIQFNVIPNWDRYDSLMKQQILQNRIDSKNQSISKFCSKIKYSLRSIILYKGNRSSGHYISLRASEQSLNCFKLINDLHVSQENSLSKCNFFSFLPLIFIYEKKKSSEGLNSSFNDKISEKKQQHVEIQKNITEKPLTKLNSNQESNKNSENIAQKQQNYRKCCILF